MKLKKFRITRIILNPKFLKIEFIDNGCGISKNDMNNIFIPFFNTKEKGSGLGLAVSQKIIHEHGGFIDISSVKKLGYFLDFIKYNQRFFSTFKNSDSIVFEPYPFLRIIKRIIFIGLIFNRRDNIFT